MVRKGVEIAEIDSDFTAEFASNASLEDAIDTNRVGSDFTREIEVDAHGLVVTYLPCFEGALEIMPRGFR
jgi:hypothetical protein